MGAIARKALGAWITATGLAVAVDAAAQDAALQQVRVAMDRATRTPLEIVWLREEVLAQLWRDNPVLAQRSGDCARAGAPRRGCTVGSPPAQRYHFGAESLADNRVAPLGHGMYLIVPRAGNPGLVRAPGGELVLAAGAAVQLVDAAYPEISVELRAPRDEALPLGNLVSADIGKAVALLARQPGLESASVASVGVRGQVAFKANDTPRPETVMVASVAPVAPAPRILPVVEADRPDPAAIATNGEGSGREFIAFVPPDTPEPQPVKVAILAVDFEADRGVRALLDAGGEGGGFVSYAPAPLKHEPVVVAAVVSDFERAPGPGRVISNGEGSGLDAVAWPVAMPAVQAKAKPVDSDVARLRAEVEAEIERERARLASTLRPASGPKRFAFSGA